MERDIIREWSSDRKMALEHEIEEKLLSFAGIIFETNQKFNLTGLKAKHEILTELIIKSIDPVCDIIVPRGTRFLDLGSGAGIPGIVLAIFFKNFSGVLVESNQKKADFLKTAMNELKLINLEVVCERAELAAKMPAYREAFDWCFTRAFGKLFIAIELGSPFVKKCGHLYVYSNELPENLPEKVLEHVEKTGLHIMSHKKLSDIKLKNIGLCFLKVKDIQDKYPRMFAVIKREAENI